MTMNGVATYRIKPGDFVGVALGGNRKKHVEFDGVVSRIDGNMVTIRHATVDSSGRITMSRKYTVVPINTVHYLPTPQDIRSAMEARAARNTLPVAAPDSRMLLERLSEEAELIMAGLGVEPE